MGRTGREAKLQTRRELSDHLNQIVQDCHDEGQGRVVRLVGEAGIGKTNVVTALAAFAVDAGCQVWHAQAAELDASTPYGLVGATHQNSRPMFDAGLLAAASGTINRFGAEVERFGVVEQIIETVESHCRVPTVMIVEDVHWADAPSLEALAMLGRVAQTHALVLVLTLRSGQTNDALDAMHRELDSLMSDSVRVGPLTEDEIDELVNRLCGGRASTELRERAQGATGNPFLVHELVDGLLAEGRLEIRRDEVHADSSDVPEQLQLAVGRELGRLGESVMTLVRAASVQGNHVDVRDLAAQLGQPIVSLAAAIEAAVDAGLLVETSGALQFRHDLVRDAAYQQMPTVVRIASHRDLATVLARRNASPALVASHLLLAGGDQPETVELLQAAATQTAPLAPTSALEFLDRARDLVVNDLDTRRVVENARLEALTAAGRLSEAEGVAHWLLQVSPPHEQSELLARLAGLALIAGDGDRSLSFGLEAIEKAADDKARSRYLGIAAVTNATNRDYAQAWKLAQQAADLGEAAGEPVGQSAGLALIARMSTYANAIDEGLRLGAQAVAIADTDPRGEAHAWVPCLHYGMTAFDADELVIAEQMVDRGMVLARTHRMEWALPLFGTLQAACHFRRGDLDVAAAEAETAVEQAHRMNSRQCITWAQSILALVTLEIGSINEARAWADAAAASWATGQPSLGVDYLALALARVARQEGNTTEAFTKLCEDWDAMGSEGLTFCHPLLARDLAELAALVGDASRFEEAVAALENAAEVGQVLPISASAQWLRAVRNEHPSSARAAVDRMRLSGRRYDLARWLSAEPQLLAQADGPAPVLHEALELFESIGALRSAALTRSRLSALGEAIDSPNTVWDALTPTELEIVRLLAEGYTNAQIAQERGSSRRTVESHLTRVYQKLNIEGRVRLTVAATEHFRTSGPATSSR